jgi:FkbH-like protein
MRSQINSTRDSQASDGEFYQTLDIRLEVGFNELNDLPRLTEMFAKTNQFNATTKRRTSEEIRDLMLDEKHEVISVRVKDRFTNHGLTSVVVLEHRDQVFRVTDWLISCRVLGRGVESGLITFLAEIAQLNGSEKFEVIYAPSKKNQQVADFLTSMQPESIDTSGRHSFSITSLINEGPDWITII